MILLHAELNYRNREWSIAYQQLNWVVRMAEAVATPYAARSPSELDTAVSIEWESVGNRACVLLAQLDAGLSFYGHAQNYVPMVTANVYADLSDQLINIGIGLETALDAYVSRVDTEQERRRALNNTINFSALHRSMLIESNADLRKRISSIERRLDELLDDQLKTELVIQAAEEAFKNAVAAKSGCGFGDVIKAAAAIAAIASGAGSIAGGVAGLGAFTEQTWKETKRWKKLIEQFKYLQENIQKIQGGLDKIRDAYQKVQGILQAKPDAATIVMEREEFDRTIKPYLDMPEARKLRDYVYHFLEVIETRKTLVLEVHALVLEHWRNTEIQDEMLAEENRVRTTLAVGTPTRYSEYESFAKRAVRRIKDDILRSLFMQWRAITYWSLREPSFGVLDDRVLHLSDYSATLKAELLRNMERLGAAPQPYRSPFPIVLTRGTHKDAFEVFYKTGRLNFRLTSREPSFQRIAMLMVTRCEVSFPDLKTWDGDIQVRLFHHGDVTVLDRSGNPYQFVHALRVATEWLDKNGDRSANINLGALDGKYAYLSPLVSWTLEINRKDHPNLNLSRIEEVQISFEGNGYATY